MAQWQVEVWERRFEREGFFWENCSAKTAVNALEQGYKVRLIGGED